MLRLACMRMRLVLIAIRKAEMGRARHNLDNVARDIARVERPRVLLTNRPPWWQRWFR
jgi:hypothetical protein